MERREKELRCHRQNGREKAKLTTTQMQCLMMTQHNETNLLNIKEKHSERTLQHHAKYVQKQQQQQQIQSPKLTKE